MSAVENAKTVYDVVAEEYDARVPAHSPNIELWVDHLASHAPHGATVLDVGCGVGLSLSVLARRGFQPTGIDASSEMVRYAKARNPSLDVLNGDFLSMQPQGPYDVLWAEAFIHLFPSTMTDQIFDKFLTTLKPNGLLTVSTTLSHEPSEGWSQKSDYATAPRRFRRHWTRGELINVFEARKLKVLDRWDITDPFGKKWMIYIVRLCCTFASKDLPTDTLAPQAA